MSDKIYKIMFPDDNKHYQAVCNADNIRKSRDKFRKEEMRLN